MCANFSSQQNEDCMRKILIFINKEPPKILRKKNNSTKIVYLYPNGIPRVLDIQTIFATFKNGKSGAICFTADRQVMLDELLQAYDELM